MSKINLNTISREQALTHIRKYCKNRIKSGCWANKITTERDIMNKFICSQELASSIIEELIQSNTSYSAYLEHFI